MNPGASIIISTIGIAAGVVVLAVGGIYYFMNQRNRNNQYTYGNYEPFYSQPYRPPPYNNNRSAPNQSNTECPICLEPLRTNRGKKTLSCGHVYHFDCIRNWYRRSSDRTCPLCRNRSTSPY